MKIKYDKEADVVYIRFSELSVAESDQEKPGIILDYSIDGQIVGIEILNASASMVNEKGILYEVAWINYWSARGRQERIGEGLNEGLNEGLRTLLLIIHNNPGIQAKDLPDLLSSRPLKTIERQLSQLIKQNFIKRHGSRKTGGYVAL